MIIMNISENTIQEVRDCDLIDIISQYVKLKKAGSGYVGSCPFHDEKTPSFSVQSGRGFYCFGCDAKGRNAIDFIMQHERKSFPDAVIHVAGMAGIVIRKGHASVRPKIKPIKAPLVRIIDYIAPDVVSKSLKARGDNNLYTFFVSLFGKSAAAHVFKQYGIGSSIYFGAGTTCFIQKDISGKMRQVKAMIFDPLTGKRSRYFEPKIIGCNLVGYDKFLVQCFFGEDLLKGNSLKVAMCESEKTAAICSILYPQFVWIATGGKNGCNMTNPEVNQVLRGKEIHLFPDVDAIEDWRKKAATLKTQGFNVFLNDLIATNAEPGSKDDIADIILHNRAPNGILLNTNDYPVLWDYQTETDNADRWITLNNLINKGAKDALLNISGAISDAEFMNRQNEIEEQLIIARINLAEYVMAFKN